MASCPMAGRQLAEPHCIVVSLHILSSSRNDQKTALGVILETLSLTFRWTLCVEYEVDP